MNYTGGKKYVGQWKDDRINGQGILLYINGLKYIGERYDGKRHGQGTMIYADGRKYVGEWKDDKKQGSGTMIYADGRKYVGEWKDDAIQVQFGDSYLEEQQDTGRQEEDQIQAQITAALSGQGKPAVEDKKEDKVEELPEPQKEALSAQVDSTGQDDKYGKELQREIAELKERLDQKELQKEKSPGKLLLVLGVVAAVIVLGIVLFVWVL